MVRLTTTLVSSVNAATLVVVAGFGVNGFTADEAPSPKPPAVNFVFPIAVGALATTDITVTGDLGVPPLQGWCDDPGVTLLSAASSNSFQVVVATNAVPGVKWLRFANPAGVSDWVPFVISDRMEQIALPDTNATVADVVGELPAAVNSRLLPEGRTNLFAVTTRTNQMLEVKLQGLALDSPVGARVQIRDERGVVLDSASTTNRVDPTLMVPMFNQARWHVEVSALTNFAPARFETDGAPFRLVVDAADLPSPRNLDGTAILVPHPELQRPNLTPRISFPGLVNGFVSDPLEEDFYGFDAVAGHAYWMRLKAATMSSPLRGKIRILDGDRNALAESLSAPDPELAWTAPGTGRYAIVISAEPGSGGWDCVYQLELGHPRAELRATLSTHTLGLPAGGSAAIEVSVVKPPDFDQLLVVSLLGLPPEITAAPAHLLPSLDRATLTLHAAARVAPMNVACQVSLMTTVPPIRVEIATVPVVGRFAPAGRLLRNEAEHIWVTVTSGIPAR